MRHFDRKQKKRHPHLGCPAWAGQRAKRAAPRRGVTLIELLIVVFVLLLITAVAIPVMAPSLQERQLRETSRLVTSHFAGARTRAIQTGRPFGVLIEPMSGLPQASTALSYVEVQPPYAGDSYTSRVVISNGQITSIFSVFGGSAAKDVYWQGLLRPGDLIKLNYQGHFYTIVVPTAGVDPATGYIKDNNPPNNPALNPPWTLVRADGSATPAPDTPSAGLPFQIYRQPVKTAATPLQLPAQMVIDLAGSGTELDFEPWTDGNNNGVYDVGETFTDLNGNGVWDTGLMGPVVVLFSPGGAVSQIIRPSGSITPTGPIHFLVGKRERVPVAVGEENWRDLMSFWVSVHPQTGLITSTELAAAPPLPTQNIVQTRIFALQAQSMGGR